MIENEDVELINKLDNPKKRKMIEALCQCNGIVSDACKKANISRTLHYFWVNNDNLYKELVQDANEVAIDFVEGQLFKKIKELDTASIIFFLKTKGKKRGYVEKENMDSNIKITIEEKEDELETDFE